MEYVIVVMAVMTLASVCMCIALLVALVRLERNLAAFIKRIGSGDDKPVKFVGPVSKKPKSKPHGGRFGNRRNPPRKWRDDKP